MEQSNKLRIAIADNHLLFRRGLRTVLSWQPDLEVVGEVASAEECFLFAQTGAAQVVVMDGELADADQHCFRRIQSFAPVLILAEPEQQNRLDASAQTYLLKRDATLGIVDAVRRTLSGAPEGPTAAIAASDLQALAASTGAAINHVTSLTARENEILKMLAEGGTAREVAEDLGLSIKTVEAHKLNVMRKLGIHNRTELVRYAVQQGVVELAPVA